MADKRSKKVVVRQVPAVVRAIAILRYLARTEMPIGVVQLANALDIIPSTCLHILRVLNSEGLASFDPVTKKYQLGAGVLALANDFARKNSLVQVVRPYIEDIARRRSCTTVAVEPTAYSYYIVVASSTVSSGMSVNVSVGTRVPDLVSATGRCFAAHGNLSALELRKKFSRLRWQNPPSFRTWYEEVQETRRRGYGVDPGNYMAGITVIAAPILLDGEMLAGALSSVKVSDQLTESELRAIADDLQQAAHKIGSQLGYLHSQREPEVSTLRRGRVSRARG